MKRKGSQPILFIALSLCIAVTGCAFDDDAAVLDTARGLPVAGAVLWLRADRGVQRDALGDVSRWFDQSEHENHAIASVRPLWLEKGTALDKPAIQFDDVNQEYFHLPDFLRSPDVTAFFVCRYNQDPANPQYIFSDFGDMAQKIFEIIVISSSYNIEIFVQDAASNILFTDSMSGTSEYHILAARLEYQTVEIYYDGVLDNSNSNGSYDPTTTWEGSQADMYPTIGGRTDADPLDYFNGEIAEIIFYNRALSSGDRREVEHYLSKKYGIPLLN